MDCIYSGKARLRTVSYKESNGENGEFQFCSVPAVASPATEEANETKIPRNVRKVSRSISYIYRFSMKTELEIVSRISLQRQRKSVPGHFLPLVPSANSLLFAYFHIEVTGRHPAIAEQ